MLLELLSVRSVMCRFTTKIVYSDLLELSLILLQQCSCLCFIMFAYLFVLLLLFLVGYMFLLYPDKIL